MLRIIYVMLFLSLVGCEVGTSTQTSPDTTENAEYTRYANGWSSLRVYEHRTSTGTFCLVVLGHEGGVSVDCNWKEQY